MRPKGRPATGNARKVKVDTRLSKDELEKLDYCCIRTGKSKSQVIREGVEVLYARLVKI